MDYQIISADGHVIEPPGMWETYLPKQFHDRAPRLAKDPEGGDAWELVPGAPPMPIGLVVSEGPWGRRYEDNRWYGCTYETIRQGAFSGKHRIDEQDVDGVDCEVIFPSQRTMSAFMAQEDDAYHLAGLDAYNTWLNDEFTAVDHTRFVSLAQMPAVDIATSVSWLRSAKSAGFRGVIISAYPSGNPDLSREDDPFWAAAEEEGMPVHIHVGLSQAGKRRTSGTGKEAAVRSGGLPSLEAMGGPVGDASAWMSKFIYSGMFDRFPGLRMVAAETGAGWIPHFLEHMDDHYWRNRTWTNATLRLLPSEYFRRNWKVTFIREPFAVAVRHWIGVDNMMWSTDYPHHRHDWPYSRRIVEESMAGVPEAERRRLVCDTAREFYRLG
ncbi:MAG TPA: amidohydrolase family protein [Acidimicrobiales bacterium]|nr:amidohydrolase family protein [Acidimicrobiales bacterium]